ncbi:hypothetical protein UA08_07936 [Talaromyces atroroseus]|uniref:Store-operated calcium entry-associated regulatory factor n=1 Tax=Talaromyces atroroseus TaxID=1441469 RepID=A0A225A9U1_TALAT|nr:hypothetical protein UA08_07936 [Talaromyces atroroseus]OKL56840.1 hypothetical protein UA08_07936 [Talaromyces atroroseus]
MKPPSTIYYLPSWLALFSSAFSETPPGPNAIRLSNVQTLTLHAHRMTWYRRVSPIHQLKCVGPSSVCRLYEVDSMRCTNQGYDYDEEDIQWTCTASLPPEFKLGSTDVICEGYRDAEDKWVLKGSCGVEYRLLLTEKGEERYGRRLRYTSKSSSTTASESENDWLATYLFAFIFICIAVVILYFVCYGENGRGNRPGQRGNNNRGGGDDDDPPPPYDYQYQSQRKRSGSGPGFWTGAAAGSAAGYTMGRRHNRQQAERETNAGTSSSSRRYDLDRDEPRPSRNFSPTRVNTGFGSTRRR